MGRAREERRTPWGALAKKEVRPSALAKPRALAEKMSRALMSDA
jgi:hypothetical protein